MRLTIWSDAEGGVSIPAEWLAPDTQRVRVWREGDTICLERLDGKPILRADIEEAVRSGAVSPVSGRP